MKLYELLTSKPFKTFYWSTGYMALAWFIDLLLSSYTLLNMPDQLTVIVGIVLATASKYVHNIKKS